MIEEVLLNTLFWDKGRVLFQSCFFALCGEFGLREVAKLLGRLRDLGMWFGRLRTCHYL